MLNKETTRSVKTILVTKESKELQKAVAKELEKCDDTQELSVAELEKLLEKAKKKEKEKEKDKNQHGE